MTNSSCHDPVLLPFPGGCNLIFFCSIVSEQREGQILITNGAMRLRIFIHNIHSSGPLAPLLQTLRAKAMLARGC